MPIYEYECQECDNEFELLILPSTKDTPRCPECKSKKIERTISRFAMSSESIRDANWKSARKKGMKVGLDKQREEVKYQKKVLDETDR